MSKTIKLTAPNGSTVSVAEGKKAELLRRGFTVEAAKSTPAKKASSSKSEK